MSNQYLRNSVTYYLIKHSGISFSFSNAFIRIFKLGVELALRSGGLKHKALESAEKNSLVSTLKSLKANSRMLAAETEKIFMFLEYCYTFYSRILYCNLLANLKS